MCFILLADEASQLTLQAFLKEQHHYSNKSCNRHLIFVLFLQARSDHKLGRASDDEYTSSATSATGESMEVVNVDSTNVDGVGLSNPQLSQSRRRMLDLINKLRSTGVQVDIDLPQVAVVGSQSAGKSSLIESISGITLPRAAGTCTRCPTECRLARSDSPWQCIVSLHRVTSSDGQPLGQARNDQFGKVIYDKAEVEDRIRRAQLAILNPDKPSSYFLEGDHELHESQLSFSQNYVTLDIKGPHVADLSFCDLPGLIASQSSSRGKNDIALVESLVTSYIKKPSCIILLTVACETDFENQGAHRLAKEHDPDGKRTIGVLTKPDRIPTGEESNWLPYIRNEKEPLEHNWFCVKQPSSNDLKSNMTWELARRMENDYFSSYSPWRELDRIYQKYLRTGNLVDRLSSVLSDLISKRLPQIHEELEKSLMTTRNALFQLPKKPSDDPRSEISALLHEFTSDVARHVEGVPIGSISPFSDPSSGGNGKGLIQSINAAQESFRISIRVTAPNFRPFEKKDASTRQLQPAPFLRHEEGDEFVDGYEEVANIPIGSKKQRKMTRIYIDEVLEVAHNSRTRELPGHYPFVVQTMFIKNIVEKWRSPALQLCKTVVVLVLEHLQGLVSKHFEHIGQGHLVHRVNYILMQHMKRCQEQAENRVEWLLQLELSPFSLNTHYLSDYKAKFLAYYKTAREKYETSDLFRNIDNYNSSTVHLNVQQPGSRSSLPIIQPIGIAKVLSGLSEMGLSGIKAEDLGNLLPPDRMAPALEIMAEVRAYFQVAYKRFTDTVPLAIDCEVVRGAERGILQLLYMSLGINGQDGLRVCQELVQENPHIADRREELRKKLERLEHASHELLSVGT